MTALNVQPLGNDDDFGASIHGVTFDLLKSEAVHEQINTAFEKSGLIVFRDVEPSSEMHVALSNVFGPMKEHPSAAMSRVDADALPGVVDMKCTANGEGRVRLGTREIMQWLPWHFDHCYNNELNRAGVLRAVDIPGEGGRTGFLDGIALYKALPAELLRRIENETILYRMNVELGLFRFGRPDDLAVITERPDVAPVMNEAKGMPRALHPAVWTRKDGEKVLHVSPWMAEGIQNQETPEGDALLQEVCQAIFALAETHAYWHDWSLSDMVIWDNWRVLHAVGGHPPQYSRRMQRTTIKGDYGLGSFENGGTGGRVLERTY